MEESPNNTEMATQPNSFLYCRNEEWGQIKFMFKYVPTASFSEGRFTCSTIWFVCTLCISKWKKLSNWGNWKSSTTNTTSFRKAIWWHYAFSTWLIRWSSGSQWTASGRCPRKKPVAATILAQVYWSGATANIYRVSFKSNMIMVLVYNFFNALQFPIMWKVIQEITVS